VSKAREKDTGRYSMHPFKGSDGTASMEKLDLTQETRPVINNFQRGNLGPDQGRARPQMPAESAGPTVPSDFAY
jgi:hypothetical protein